MVPLMMPKFSCSTLTIGAKQLVVQLALLMGGLPPRDAAGEERGVTIVRELAELIEKRGGEVKFAIHPVAGRMPGHMNVLLAEAEIPYDALVEMDEINPELPQTDVCVVVGANDVVNPAARSDKSSPIYGMPILDADKAQHVIIVKRSMNPGFAGVDNPLYYEPRTTMLFGDAKGAVTKLVAALKDGVG